MLELENKMKNIEKPITVYIAGIQMTVDVFGSDEMSQDDWMQKTYEIIKSRLLEQWNAYCE